MSIKALNEKDQKAELTLLMAMEELSSMGERREFAKSIGIDWEEYLRIKRKYKRILERYHYEQKAIK